MVLNIKQLKQEIKFLKLVKANQKIEKEMEALISNSINDLGKFCVYFI